MRVYVCAYMLAARVYMCVQCACACVRKEAQTVGELLCCGYHKKNAPRGKSVKSLFCGAFFFAAVKYTTHQAKGRETENLGVILARACVCVRKSLLE